MLVEILQKSENINNIPMLMRYKKKKERRNCKNIGMKDPI